MNISKKNLLIEIGTEDLPAKDLKYLAEKFTSNFKIELNKLNFSYNTIKWFATSRRLALKVIDLAEFQSNSKIEKRGPSINDAFDTDGNPSEKTVNWMRKYGLIISQIERLVTDKGEWLIYRSYIQGKSIDELLPMIVTTSLKKIKSTKLMRWGSSDIYFIRPIRNVTVLYGNKIIPANIFNIKSNNIIYGHRFIGEYKILIDDADQYPKVLLDRGKVIADYEERKFLIKSYVENEASKINGIVNLNTDFLEELTSLIEWPVILIGKFADKFLNMPTELLIHIIENIQKCIPIYSTTKKLLSNFIIIANTESSDYSVIISDNEKIMHSRLSDAEFFLKMDRKNRLEDNITLLNSVIFHRLLGNMYESTNRIKKLSGFIANKIGANVDFAIRAGLLSKCDLITNMVSEFSEMQGIIGMYYARYDDEEEDVAISLNEQYHPLFFGDKLPSNLVSCSLSIANKIDVLVGILGIGQHPHGNKDPFAIRRNTFGIINIITEKKINLDLKIIIERSVKLYNEKLSNVNVVNDVINFIFGRCIFWYKNKGFTLKVIKSVLACQPTNLVDLDARIKAVSKFILMKGSCDLIITNNRINNILLKFNQNLNKDICFSLLKETAEIRLANYFDEFKIRIKSYFNKSLYLEVLINLMPLTNLVNDFFKYVKVDSKNKDIKINRLTLLFKINQLLSLVADIKLL